jgi:hypothetical protein
MIQAGSGAFFISPDGIIEIGANSATLPDTPVVPIAPANEPADEPVNEEAVVVADNAQVEQAEVKAFLKWAKKSQDREFEFMAVDTMQGMALNAAYKTGDTDLIKALADGVLKKV